jgi:tripartite-type tricarboxylate transporter receptor subunit TctC
MAPARAGGEVLVRSSMVALALMAALSVALAASAAEFSSRAVRIIVPYAAGGPTDAAARLIAEAMRPHLGKPVVVENRGGGGSIPGTEAVIHAPPDGYTLLLGAAGPLVVVPLAKPVRYDVAKDLVPIAQVWRSSQILAVNRALGLKTVADFVAYAKKNPGRVTVGSAGVGTLPHLSIELFKREAGIDLVHVPYRGTGAALPNLVGGQIDALFGDTGILVPSILANNIVALAVTSPERSPMIPDIPTMAEVGYPALETESWYGLLAPAGVPAPVIRRLETAARSALSDAGFRENVLRHGAGLVDTSSEKFRDLIRRETEKWKPIVQAPGFQLP